MLNPHCIASSENRLPPKSSSVSWFIMDMMGYHDILHQMVTFWGVSTVSTVSTNLPGHQWWTEGGAIKFTLVRPPNQHQIYTYLLKERPPKWTDPIPSLPVVFLLCCLKTQGKHCYRNDRNDFFCSLAAFIRIFSCCWAVWDRAKHGPHNDQKPCSLSESFTPLIQPPADTRCHGTLTGNFFSPKTIAFQWQRLFS